MNEEKRSVACFGSGDGQPGEPMYDAMMGVGRLLAKAGVTILTGGFSGEGMEAAPRGAREVGGESIGYTILGRPGNPCLTNTIDCHDLAVQTTLMPPFAEFGIRLCALMNATVGFIIAAGGGAGTAIELFTAVQLNKKVYGKIIPGEKRRIAILKLADTDTAGWNVEMLNHLQDWGILQEEGRELIRVVATPEEAVDWVLTGNLDASW